MEDYDILVRIVDAGENSKASKAGDCIAIMPTGHVWTEIELKNPQWRIIRTKMLPSLVEALLSQPEEEQDKINKGHRRRDWKVDLSLLPDPTKFEGHHREGFTVIPPGEILSAVKQKPGSMGQGGIKK